MLCHLTFRPLYIRTNLNHSFTYALCFSHLPKITAKQDLSPNSNPKPKPVVIREVWSHNLYSEFALIGSVISRYPFVSMDTEFPGFVFKAVVDYSKPYYARNKLQPSDKYRHLITNVDSLNIIQLGLTLAEANGNLPEFGQNKRFIWEFNFAWSSSVWFNSDAMATGHWFQPQSDTRRRLGTLRWSYDVLWIGLLQGFDMDHVS